MAVREAKLRIGIDRGRFRAGLRAMQSDTRIAGKKMGGALGGSFKTGFRAASKDTFRDMQLQTKSLAANIVTLGGAISAGALVKGAIDADKEYRALATSIRTFAGEAIKAGDAQGIVERTADDTKDSLSNLRLAMQQLVGLGDLDMIEESLRRSNLQARRLGANGQSLAAVYSRLISKGVADSAQEAEILVEQMNKFGRSVLGLSVDEALDPNDISEFASFVNAAGSNVGQMTALLGQTGSTAKDLGQALEIVEELGLVLNSRKGLAELRKETGLTRDDINQSKGAVENLLTVLEKGGEKGFKKLQDALGTDRARQAIEEVLGKGLAVDIEAGKVDQEKFQARVKNLRDMLKGAEEAGVDWEQIMQDNADITSGGAASFQQALNNMEKAFQEPKTIEAINKLAELLPRLTSAFADLLEFAMESPLTAGATFLGGRAALGAGKTLIRQVFEPKAGAATRMAAEFTAEATKPSKWKKVGAGLGKAVGVAAAAVAAFEIGQEMGKQAAKPFSEPLVKAAETRLELEKGTLTRQEKIQRVARFKTTVEKMQREGTSTTQDVFGFISGLMGGKTAEEAQGDAIKALTGAIKSLEKNLEHDIRRSSDKTSRTMNRLPGAIGSAVGRAVGPGEGSKRGPNSPGTPPSGGEPRKG